MLTLVKLPLILAAGVALLGRVAAAPAIQIPTTIVCTASHDAIVPITTVTETYYTQSSLSTATITISEFTDGNVKREKPTAPLISAPTADSIPHNSSHGRPSSFFIGVPTYSKVPEHVSGHGSSVLHSVTRLGGPGIEIARETSTKTSHGLPTGALDRRQLTGSTLHDTTKSYRKSTGVAHMPRYSIPITEGNIEAMHTARPEGVNNIS